MPPRKTPRLILEARGSRLAASRGDELAPTPGVPRPPRWVSARGRKLWPQLCRDVETLGCITVVDGQAMGLLVDALASYVEARDAAETLPRGDLTRARLARQRDRLWGQVLKLLGEFGLTPAARTSLRLPTKAPATARDKSRFFHDA